MAPYTEVKNNNNKTVHFNPFPGLRPFTTDESHLFFGREGQSQEVLKFLAQNRFVALLGTSGSGKSSLMYCGVIPILQGGFITKAGAEWQIITCRPGQSPIRNLANAISEHVGGEEELRVLENDYIYSTLSASSVGLVEAIKQVPKGENENILLLVDQFEELFRFRRIKDSVEATNEVLAYIKLLIEVLKQKDNPIYVVITMRSDFIGECAQFQELTQLINDSHYLIPQMTRDNFREAIEGPIAVGGGKITPFLVQQLLNDIGDNPDQLPILQHALMRTWDAWVQSGRFEEPIDIKDYENIGRLTKALSEHANEAFNELNQREKDICQSVFKTLTEKAGDNRGVRRPTAISEISEIAIAEPKEVINVIEHFRKAGRSFLAPGAAVALNNESVIDISHESLMRIWDKLIIWVSEEYEAVQMYKRLSDSSEKYQLGETALWRPPDLQLAINWREKQKPTLTWAKRHNPAFERTMVYLETSHKEYQLEEENKIKQQKRALRRTRMFAVVLGTASIISIFFMINSFLAKQEADIQKAFAEEKKIEAEQQKEEAQKQTILAEEATQKAKESEKDALNQKELAEKQKRLAVRSEKEALKQKEIANAKSIEASQQKELAELSAEEAKKQAEIAEKAKQDAQKLRMLSISQSMAVKSVQIDIDTVLKGLVAYQSYKFNNEFGGRLFDPDIYNGLYYAQKFFFGNQLTDYIGHENQVREIVLPKNSDEFFTTGSGGEIFKWNQKNISDTLVVLNTFNINRSMVISSSNNVIYLGVGNGDVLLLDLLADSIKAEPLYTFKNAVSEVELISDSQLLSISTKGDWAITDINSKKSKVIEKELSIRELIKYKNGFWAVGSEGYIYEIKNLEPFEYSKYAVVFSADGKRSTLVEQNDNDENTELSGISIVNALGISEDGSFLTIGDLDGNILVWDFNKREFINRLTGHTARINDIEFSLVNNLMATASNDGKIIIWNTNDFNLQPLILTDNDAWVMTLKFNANGDNLYAGYKDGKLRKWATSVVPVAEKVRSKLTRNFTIEEWQQFVAKDIDYKTTIEPVK